MAIRNIVTKEDPILSKPCRTVEVFDDRLAQLIDDMCETLEKAEGLGLAAPQVGVLKRVFVMNVGDGFVEAVNPVILKESGKQRGLEGCLSCPHEWGYVTRPNKCTLRAQDRTGAEYTMQLKEIGARCACHETDHLDGELFLRLVEQFVQLEEEN